MEGRGKPANKDKPMYLYVTVNGVEQPLGRVADVYATATGEELFVVAGRKLDQSYVSMRRVERFRVSKQLDGKKADSNAERRPTKK